MHMCMHNMYTCMRMRHELCQAERCVCVCVCTPLRALLSMAALLVHDLRNPAAPSQPAASLGHPWELASCQAFHGGSFRTAVRPGCLGPWQYVAAKLFGAAPPPPIAGGAAPASAAHSQKSE